MQNYKYAMPHSPHNTAQHYTQRIAGGAEPTLSNSRRYAKWRDVVSMLHDLLQVCCMICCMLSCRPSGTRDRTRSTRSVSSLPSAVQTAVRRSPVCTPAVAKLLQACMHGVLKCTPTPSPAPPAVVVGRVLKGYSVDILIEWDTQAGGPQQPAARSCRLGTL